MLRGLRGRLLEIGCGTGVMVPDLLAMGFEVCGIDVSSEMVRRADQHMAGHPLASRCRLNVGDVERLEFPDAFFDVVLAMGVLEYLPSYHKALQEIARVLKPSGHVVLAVPNRASAYHVLRAAYLRTRQVIRRPRATQWAGNPCVPWRLDRDIAAVGLGKVESEACNFIFFPLKELSQGASDALNRALMPLSRTTIARLLGSQYMVKGRKSARRSP